MSRNFARDWQDRGVGQPHLSPNLHHPYTAILLKVLSAHEFGSSLTHTYTRVVSSTTPTSIIIAQVAFGSLLARTPPDVKITTSGQRAE
jgi:hypothetical protein